jgi:hypothetical protein
VVVRLGGCGGYVEGMWLFSFVDVVANLRGRGRRDGDTETQFGAELGTFFSKLADR